MALIESLKAFYKDNVENVDKLNDADSILEVLRAKYGNYKGSNIEEYFKELVNNGISPGGGGGGDLSTATMTIVNNRSDDLDMVSLSGSFALTDGEKSASFYEISVTKGTPVEASVILYKGKGAMFLDVNPSTINVTLDGDITSIGEGVYLVTGDCTLTVADK